MCVVLRCCEVKVVSETFHIQFRANFKLYLTKIYTPNLQIGILNDKTLVEVVGAKQHVVDVSQK